jgi:hypothetical protein
MILLFLKWFEIKQVVIELYLNNFIEKYVHTYTKSCVTGSPARALSYELRGRNLVSRAEPEHLRYYILYFIYFHHHL